MLPSCLDRTNSHLKRISVSKREKEGRRHDERGKEGENYGQVGPSNVTMSGTDRRQRKILVFFHREAKGMMTQSNGWNLQRLQHSRNK